MTDTTIRSVFTAEKIKWLTSNLFDLLQQYYLGVISFVATLVIFTHFFFIGVSLDQSLPDDHLYVVKKWDVIPVLNAKYGIRTVDGPLGPPGGLILAKHIYGLPGDLVQVGGEDGRDVFINGNKVAHAKRFSKDGKPLTVIQGGVIPEGVVFVGTPSKDSYDSRYATMGLVPFSRIEGRIVTLF